MRKPIFVLLILLIALAACDTSEPDPTAAPRATATPAGVGYSGPSLTGLGSNEEVCGEGSECSAGLAVDLDLEGLNLASTEIGGVTIEVPEGYSPLESGDMTLISATSPDALGGYVFTFRRVDDAALQPLLARYPDLAAGSAAHPTYDGTWAARGDAGAVAVLTNANGEHLWVEASAASDFWAQFQPLFEGMLRSIVF